MTPSKQELRSLAGVNQLTLNKLCTNPVCRLTLATYLSHVVAHPDNWATPVRYVKADVCYKAAQKPPKVNNATQRFVRTLPTLNWCGMRLYLISKEEGLIKIMSGYSYLGFNKLMGGCC